VCYEFGNYFLLTHGCALHHHSASNSACLSSTTGFQNVCVCMHLFLAAGMRGYTLQQCLKEERKRREAEQGSEEQQERQRLKYEQPGELVTLPSGE
jgi:hypothetical protein